MTNDKQRERLVELIGQTVEDPALTCPRMGTSEGCEGCKYLKDDSCDTAGGLADYLLANGVVALPEKVYWYGFDGKIREATVKDEFVAELENGFEYDIPYKEIGKTVFLTKEEAEAKLRKEQKR